jgi:hypothetical protein
MCCACHTEVGRYRFVRGNSPRFAPASLTTRSRYCLSCVRERVEQARSDLRKGIR